MKHFLHTNTKIKFNTILYILIKYLLYNDFSTALEIILYVTINMFNEVEFELNYTVLQVLTYIYFKFVNNAYNFIQCRTISVCPL